MTALNQDYRYTSNTLDQRIDLRFGRRTGPGGGTDQTRFAQQCVIHDDPVFGHVMRTEVNPQDTAQWAASNATEPCAMLIGTTSWMARQGDEGWFHIVFDPTDVMYELLWELHNSAVKSTIAPFGLLAYAQSQPWETVVNGKIVAAGDPNTRALTLRVATGSVPSGGGNQSFWHPNIMVPGFQPLTAGWTHVLLGIHFAEDTGGWLELTAWKHGDPVPSVPNLRLENIPTCVWSGSGGSRVHDGMYPQWGEYGYPTKTDVMTHAGWTVRPTPDLALADFPLGTVPIPPDPPPNPLNLKLLSHADGSWWLEWTAPLPPPIGYVLYVDGHRTSNSWDGAKTSWKVTGPGPRPSSSYRVVALGSQVEATV